MREWNDKHYSNVQSAGVALTAYYAGRDDFCLGRPNTNNPPYYTEIERAAWVRGWNEAKADFDGVLLVRYRVASR